MAVTVADAGEPRLAKVNTRTDTFSGPGRPQDYPTDRLSAGQRVEVYQQENGWCAIRPPHTAFSIVAAADVEQIQPLVVRVKRDGARCHIGGSLSDSTHADQIRLKAGELLSVLEILHDSSGNSYKVAPPAGEFRWVRESELRFDEEIGSATVRPVTAPDQPGMIKTWQPADPRRIAALLPAEQPAPTTTANPSESARYQPLGGTRTTLATQPLPPAEAPRELPAAANIVTNTSQPIASGMPTANVEVGPVQAMPTAIAGSTLEQLETELAKILVDQPQTWNFAALNERAERLWREGDSAVERSKVRIFQNKLARFDEIKQRAVRQQALADSARTRGYQSPEPVARGTAFPVPRMSNEWVPGVPPTATQLAQRGASLTPAGATLSTAAALGGAFNNSVAASTGGGMAPTFNGFNTAAVPTGPAGVSNTRTETELGRYDGIGTLAEFRSLRPNAPKYALLYDQGKIVSFITPAPGVDLQAYLKQKIGVAGERGFMPELQRPHVTVQSVGPTDPATIARMRDSQLRR